MQSQFGWNTQQTPVMRPTGARMGIFQAPPGGGPYSYPGPRSAQLPVRQPSSNCAHTHVHNEDYGNLVSQGFGPTWQGDHPVGSPYSEACCSPPQDVGWISPMDAQPVYLSPVLLQSHLMPPIGQFMHAPSFSATSQSSVSDSEEETVCARSPDSGSHFHHIPAAHFPSTHVFEMDLDEPSTTTTAGDEDDGDEDETTYDEAEAWEEPYGGDDLDTTVDYSAMRGAVESHLDVEDFDVSLPASKTPCLDALAFCIVLRLGAYQTPEDQAEGAITITNFHKLLTGIHHFCPKKSQTANEEARIKALKRWFEGIPTKRKRDTTFIMRIKDRKNPVVFQIIQKLQKYCIVHGFVKAANPLTQQMLRPMDP